jgi:Mrp family chromosome partitioning ATPase
LTANPAVCQENLILIDENAEKNSLAMAAYRILRTRLLQRARLRQWTTIGVTSAGTNEGKSITTLNLGLGLARERNSDVVLLDLDMRNPCMSRYLGVDPPHQLLDYFEHRVNVEDVFFSIGIDRLLLASGTAATDSASELLGTRQFDDLKDYIKQHTVNPIVLIDLPPLLVTDDTLVVAPRIDAMLVVAAEGRTDRTALNKALELLKDYTVAGLVLNRSTAASGQYDYGYASTRF